MTTDDAKPLWDPWESLTLEELAKAQNVAPFDVRTILGTWPGEDDDGFEDMIKELRRPPGK